MASTATQAAKKEATKAIKKEVVLGVVLVLAWLGLTFGLYLALPGITSSYGLTPLSKFGATTTSLIYLTIGLWGSSTVIGLSRAIVWILAYYGPLSGDEYTRYMFIVSNFFKFTVWALAISTVLTGYLTQWFA